MEGNPTIIGKILFFLRDIKTLEWNCFQDEQNEIHFAVRQRNGERVFSLDEERL